MSVNGVNDGVFDPKNQRSVRLFWNKVNKTDGCWLWIGAVTQCGYGKLRRGGNVGKIVLAHRASYILRHGSIPDGKTIDHLCRVHVCVNPDHLEAVTNEENILRGVGPTAMNKRKTHCVRGHEFTPENTGAQKKNGRRYCKKCNTEAGIRWIAENLEANRKYKREWAAKKAAKMRAMRLVTEALMDDDA